METINGAPIIDVFLPTFRLEPGENERFYPSRARATAERAAAAEIGEAEYNDEDAKVWSLNISDKVREEVAASLKKSRFKVVVQTVIGQIKDQGIRVASRCLWDPTTDNYASYTYQNRHLFCTVLIFATYTD
jgi:hypothetical protein